MSVVHQMTDAVRQHLDRYTIAIVLFRDALHDSMDVGSGVGIKLRGRFWVATAAHNIKDLPNDRIYLVHSRTRSEEQIQILTRGHVGGDDDSDLDLAWLEVDSRSPLVKSKEFITPERFGNRPVEGDVVQVHGYPAVKANVTTNEAARERTTGLNSLGFTTEVAGSVASNERTFALAYGREGRTEIDGRPAAFTEPGGLSGGGVWNMHADAEGLWTPDKARLVGVQFAFNREQEFLRCNDIRTWQEHLESFLDHER